MLILKRRPEQTIKIGPDIVVYVLDFQHGQVRIGIDAPKEVVILRGELPPLPEEAK